MPRRNDRLVLLLLGAFALNAQGAPGESITAEDLRPYFSIPPSGDGLPHGNGSATQGAEIYRMKCAMCHGTELQGIPATGGPALIGGRNSLRESEPLKTVESYWPYATTLFDYIWRAMPFFSPGSLTPDEVYALCAYILAEGDVIDDELDMNQFSLPKVRMPNAEGFYEDK